MEISAELQKSFDRLNPEQREAVEHIDGPLLVIAGPGTGKTQLLSLRAANILLERDVKPENILCLTYTEAGTAAMRKRLIELVGRPAYGIQVSTFHGFCAQLSAQYPQYFPGAANRQLITSLHAKKTLNSLLNALTLESPFHGSTYMGKNSNLKPLEDFISKFRKSGLTTSEFRAIQEQNLAFFTYMKQRATLFDLFASGIPRAKAEKAAYFDSIIEEVDAAFDSAPKELTQPVVSTPGVYVPYARLLYEAAPRFDTPTTFRDEFFAKDDQKVFQFKDEERCRKAIEASRLYDQYRAYMSENGLYDFDDMIIDALAAIETHPSLKYALQSQYQYILVDEFQDTNGAQMHIVELLTEGIDSPNVMVVGDDDQAIMRFQGASLAYVHQFAETYDPKKVVLKANYRSTPAIVGLGQGVARQIERRMVDDPADKDIVAFREDNPQDNFTETVFPSEDMEYYAIAKDIRDRLDAGFMQHPRCVKHPDEAIAVICSKHKHLEALIPYLRYFKIPFNYVKTAEVSKLETMQTLLSMLRFASAYSQGSAKKAMAYLPQIVASPELGISPSACIRFAKEAKDTPGKDWIRALRQSENKRLQHIWTLLEELSAQAPSAPVTQLISKAASPIAAYYKTNASANPLDLVEFNAGIRALLEFAKGEVSLGKAMGRCMRLKDVIEHYEQALDLGVAIDTSVKFGKGEAVQLTSAHGSKGLQYELVYLLHADNDTWHKTSGGSNLYARNMLITDEKDEDDNRRLLFVAVTRAKTLLEFYRAKGVALQELQDVYAHSKQEEVSEEELAQVIQIDWEQSYEPGEEDIRELLIPDLAKKRLSASALNAFVTYEEGCANSSLFPAKQILYLPEEPNPAADFGTIVHDFLENYAKQVRLGGVATLDDCAEAARDKISRLDYDDETLDMLLRRFGRIVKTFIPWFDENIQGGMEVERWLETDIDGVPVTAKCDVILVDDQKKELRVIDYKTGFSYPGSSPDPKYERQLWFYRLALENHPDFEGYRMVEGVDIYVEPERRTAEHIIHPPVRATASDQDVAYLRRLIMAVWDRIQRGDFDTSAFETSELLAAAKANSKTKTGKPKDLSKKEMQRIYEQWLIEEYEARE
ncbi:MAG: ATP-dependent helicase [Coriobacteriales bacterium]|nr:ATP-dependent helicase [Coriobacteriales bacterium]